MAKQTELKERGTNTLLYPVTTVAQVLGTDGNPITDKVLPTKGAEGTILTVKNGAVTWDAPTSGEITSADLDLINYIKGIGSGNALVPESEGSSILTNTKITLNHYLDIITLNGNYSLMLDSGFISNLPATGKHVVFRNADTETRIITLPNNEAIKSDKETLTVTAQGYAEIDLIKGSTGTILIKSSVL